MKITLNGYDIDLKVKASNEGRYNKKALRGFLTDLALMAIDSEEFSRQENSPYIEKKAQKYEEELTAIIDKLPTPWD